MKSVVAVNLSTASTGFLGVQLPADGRGFLVATGLSEKYS